MDTTIQIEKFSRDIRRVNRREIILSILAIPFVIGLMLILGLFTDNAPVGSLRFFGFLLMILAILFNISMIWFVDSPRGDLSNHPASNVDHWAAEMLRRAKLLRLVPLWGLGPAVPVIALLLWPTDEVDLLDMLSYSVTIAVVVLAFAVVTWLNLRAASKLTLETSSLKEAQGIQPTS